MERKSLQRGWITIPGESDENCNIKALIRPGHSPKRYNKVIKNMGFLYLIYLFLTLHWNICMQAKLIRNTKLYFN